MDYEKATQALAQIASRYQGETGFTAHDNVKLSTMIECVMSALKAGKAADDKLSEQSAKAAKK